MNVESYNHQLQQKQPQSLQEQQTGFANYAENDYRHTSDTVIANQPSAHSYGYANPNQLAPNVNKMSLQDEQLKSHSQFSSPLRPDEHNGMNGMNGVAFGELGAGPEPKYTYPAMTPPLPPAANHITGPSEYQFKANTGLPPPPSSSSMAGSRLPLIAQNGGPQFSGFEQNPGQVAPRIANSYVPSLVSGTYSPLTPPPSTSPVNCPSGPAPVTMGKTMLQYSQTNHIEPPGAPLGSSKPSHLPQQMPSPQPTSHQQQQQQMPQTPSHLQQQQPMPPPLTRMQQQKPMPPPPSHLQQQQQMPPPPSHLQQQQQMAQPLSHLQQQQQMPPPPSHLQQQQQMPPPPSHLQQQQQMPPPPSHLQQQQQMPPPPSHLQQQQQMPPPPSHLQQQQQMPPPPSHLQQQQQLPPLHMQQQQPPPQPHLARTPYGPSNHQTVPGAYPAPQTFPPMPQQRYESRAPESLPTPSSASMPYPLSQSMPGGYPSVGGYRHPQPGMEQSMQGEHQRRLDPDQMPNPIQVMSGDQKLHNNEPFITNQVGHVPPLVTTKFSVQDEGNVNPRFVRSTMYSIPCGTDMMKQADIPFSLVITPFATLAPEEQLPPVVNTGDLGPVRCVRCKAYVNSFMKFVDGGRRFVCILCSAVTEVPTEYFQHLDHTGNRVDRYERPELLYGAYEFTVNKDYCKDGEIPNVPAFIFVIDVSYNNVKSGFVHLLCENMIDIISNHLPVDEQASESHVSKRIRVGFITYDTTVHFYNIKSCLGQPQMMTVGDMEDMFVPLVDGFLCDPVDSRVVIDTLMRQIPHTFANTRETDPVLLPAVQAGLEALKAAKCVGKLLVFHSSLPTGNVPGKLINREDRKLLATEKEKTILTPQNASYTTLAQECVTNSCSIDLFVLNNSHVDLATVGQLSKVTGGEIFKYTYFQADVDGDRLLLDVKRNLQRQIAFDAVLRVRTSTGVRPVAFYGHLHMSNTTDIELASINADKSVAVEIKHDDKLNEEDVVFVQVATLYTSCFGERRVRILNLALSTCTQLADLFRHCELDALINYWSKVAVTKLLEGTPRQVRESLVSRCVRILACYRKLCASPSSPGQLILPECLKLLPLYLNCLLKSDAISGGSDMTVDDRYFMMQVVSIADVPSSVNYFYPRLLPLVRIDYASDEIPTPIRCTGYKLSNSEAYLLENGVYMFLWLGSKLPNEWLGNVFGVADASQIGSNLFQLPEFDNVYSRKVHSLISHIQNERRRSMKLTIVREQDKMEIVFKRFLVEDGTPGVATSADNYASAPYVDFLCQMHKEIRNTLS